MRTRAHVWNVSPEGALLLLHDGGGGDGDDDEEKEVRHKKRRGGRMRQQQHTFPFTDDSSTIILYIQKHVGAESK